jgi:hypothetical protein
MYHCTKRRIPSFDIYCNFCKQLLIQTLRAWSYKSVADITVQFYSLVSVKVSGHLHLCAFCFSFQHFQSVQLWWHRVFLLLLFFFFFFFGCNLTVVTKNFISSCYLPTVTPYLSAVVIMHRLYLLTLSV